MPYKTKKVGNTTCVYKADTGKKVGCTSGPINKYMAALHMHEPKEELKLSEIAKSVLHEESEKVIAKNIKAVVSDVEQYLSKPENIGSPFSAEENEVINELEIKPDKLSSNSVKFSSIDGLSGNNKELVIIKKQNRYVGFYSLSKPVDLTAGEDPENVDIEKEEEKTVVIIKVSSPFKDNKPDDVSLLSNFITTLVSEYQIK